MKKQCFMFSSVISVAICIAIIINLFATLPITVYAFDRSVYNGLCPITIYPCTDDDTFPAYSTVECTTKIGTIYRTDRCTIIKFYTNSNGDDVCKVKYPVSGGATKTAYAKTSRFIYDKSFTPTAKTATAKTNVSAYAGASTISGWYISSGDKIYILGRDGSGNTQVAYPTDDGYKIAWVKYYTVKFNANGGSKAPSAQYKTQNVNLTITSSKPTRTGYTFNSWNTGKSGGGTKYSSGGTYKANSSDTLYAQWTINSYKLTVSSADTSMGTVSGGGTYNYGNSAILKATPKAGHSFVKWSDGNTSATRTVSVSKAATYTASFKTNSYTITANSANSSMGTVSGGGSYNYGKSVTLKATPAEHYHFVRWSDGNTSNPRKISVGAANATYMAVFAIDTHKISVSSADIAMGSVSGSGTYDYLSKAIINATPGEGYKFVMWSDGSTSQFREISVTGDAEYTAVFEADPISCKHSYGDWEVIEAASCVAAGKQMRVCSKCQSVQNDIVEMIPHQYEGDWIVQTAATCDEDGVQYRNCILCGNNPQTEQIAKSGHDYSIWEISEYPSCTQSGVKIVLCSICGRDDDTQAVAVEATGHTYGEWITDKSALCTESGLRHRVCSVCFAEEQEVTEEIGHQIKETVIEPTEDKGGLIHKMCTNVVDGVQCKYSEEIPLYPTTYAGSLTTENFYVKQGDTISIPVKLSDNPGITGFIIMLQYDSSSVVPVQRVFVDEQTGETTEKWAAAGDALPNASFVCYNMKMKDEENGTDSVITVDYTGATAAYDNGVLFYVDFKVVDDASAGVYPIVVSYESILGEEIVPSGIVIGETDKVFLSVTPSIENGVIIVTDESSATVMRGDVTVDGIVDKRDSIYLARYIIETVTFTERQLTAADVYKDSRINTKDSVRLSQLIVGWELDDEETASLCSADAQSPVVSAGVCEAEVGEYADVPVIIENNSGIAGFHLKLHFDKEYLYPVSITENGILGDEIRTNIQEDADNSDFDYVSLQWSEADNIFANGTICTVRFKVKDTAADGQTIPIELSAVADDPVCSVSGSDINDVTAVLNSGSVLAKAQALDENIKYKVEGIALTLDDGIETNTIPTDTAFDASVEFTPLTDELTPGILVIALYDNAGCFAELQSKTIDLKMLMDGAYTFAIPESDNISGIKVYIWDSLSSLKPLSNKMSLQ